jgi:hypothetical protein
MSAYALDELTFVQLTRLFDRYPHQRVAIHAPDGVAVMGYVPHEERGPVIERTLKPGVCRGATNH